ncbi:MAG: hypothetical protein P8075_07145 [Deltaproteobacteria bacterium]
MVRYYGYFSDVSRDTQKKKNEDNLIPCILKPDESSKASRKNWARLIRKIYEVDPLVCPKCNYQMRILSFMEDQAMISKILKHLRLYLVRSTLPARAPTQSPPVR